MMKEILKVINTMTQVLVQLKKVLKLLLCMLCVHRKGQNMLESGLLFPVQPQLALRGRGGAGQGPQARAFLWEIPAGQRHSRRLNRGSGRAQSCDLGPSPVPGVKERWALTCLQTSGTPGRQGQVLTPGGSWGPQVPGHTRAHESSVLMTRSCV